MNERITTDVAIVGAGIAGLMTAIKVAPLRAVVICKNHLGSGAATDWAQGGIAAAVGPDDSPVLHSLDTRRAGAGISDRAIVDILTRDAPARIEELLALGAHFDRTLRGDLALGREAAHNRRRIVRSGGDATGHEILGTLIAAVRSMPTVQVIEETVAQELLTAGAGVTGVDARNTRTGALVTIEARATVFATGGIGHLYSRTTNPPEACGDGIALAARAGALLSDMEFVQFHPTALQTRADPMPLASEALRGEGAVLINAIGERFMQAIHPDAELAPRDVVARAIFEQGRRGQVFLDARAALGASILQRFPTVAAACAAAGIDPTTRPIPVAPAAHYHMGGISIDAWGRTSLEAFWAAGEASASGMHGANRLASNSLLEALGFADRVASDIKGRRPGRIHRATSAPTGHATRASQQERAAIAKLRAAMYRYAGLVRDGAGLQTALAQIDEIAGVFTAPSLELRNLLDVARLITNAALSRRESRGSHYRSDYPVPDRAFAKRSFTTLEGVA